MDRYSITILQYGINSKLSKSSNAVFCFSLSYLLQQGKQHLHQEDPSCDIKLRHKQGPHLVNFRLIDMQMYVLSCVEDYAY